MHMSCIIGHLNGVKLAYQCNASSQASSSKPLIRRHPPWGLSKALGKKICIFLEQKITSKFDFFSFLYTSALKP